MKHTVLLVVVLLLWACSRTQKTEKTVVTQLRTHKEAVDTLRTDPNAPEKPLEVNNLANEKVSEVFASHDLSELWSSNRRYAAEYNPETEKEEYTETNHNEPPVYNGFYGADYHRIEMYFASVTRDKDKPNVYHVTGKSRFKKNITPFVGTIVLDSIAEFQDPNIDKQSLKEMDINRFYATTGAFELREDSTFAGSGVFSGKMAMDFATTHTNDVRLWYFSSTDDAQGAGFLFDGDWKSYKTGKTKPITWAKDIFMIGNNILEEFSIGERDVEINPKYRKLGWDNFWENEEWWNEPAKTAM